MHQPSRCVFIWASQRCTIPHFLIPLETSLANQTPDSFQVSLTYQLDSEKLSYEMGMSTANELFLRFVRTVLPSLSVGAELHSRHFPPKKGTQLPSSGKKPIGHTVSRASLALRWSNLNSAGQLASQGYLPLPLEATAFTTLGQHFGVSFATKVLNERLAVAVSWKKRCSSPQQKLAIGMRLNFHFQEIPAVFKLTLSSHAGIAAFLGTRLSGCLGVGIGASIDHWTSTAKAALFLDI